MQVDLGSLLTKVQSLVEDPTGQWCTKPYMLATVALAWDDLSTELSMLDLGYDEDIAVIENVPANLTDLSPYQAQGQPLANIMRPKLLEWKLPTDPDTSYDDAAPVDRLPDRDPGAQGIAAYTFRKQIIQITPSSVPVTIRVTSVVMNVTLIDDNDTVIAGCQSILAYRVSEKINARRGNPQLAGENKTDGDAAMGTFELLCVRLGQRKVRRFGRATSRFTRGRFIAR